MSKPKRTAELPALVAERARLVGRIAAIDVQLKASGIVMAVSVPRSRPARAAILAALSTGEKTGPALATLTGQGLHAVQQMIHLLVKAGTVRRARHGVYALADTAKKGEPT